MASKTKQDLEAENTELISTVERLEENADAELRRELAAVREKNQTLADRVAELESGKGGGGSPLTLDGAAAVVQASRKFALAGGAEVERGDKLGAIECADGMNAQNLLDHIRYGRATLVAPKGETSGKATA